MRPGVWLAWLAGTLGLLALAPAASASTLFDFVTLDRIDYIRWADEPGRPLGREDLGAEFATIGCSLGEDTRSCAYGLDAAAAFLPAGTRMYAVRGYATEFRLAAVWRDRIFLYQAWRNPRARRGGDLFDIAGKVRAVDVRRGADAPPSPEVPAAAVSATDAEALVAMILGGAIRAPRPHPAGEARYWLTIWLADGTALSRPYFAETGELLGGLVPAAAFRAVLDRYVAD